MWLPNVFVLAAFTRAVIHSSNLFQAHINIQEELKKKRFWVKQAIAGVQFIHFGFTFDHRCYIPTPANSHALFYAV